MEPETTVEGEVTETVEIERRATGTTVATSDELTVEQVLGQVHLVQEVMRQAMQENVHYGRIPGVAKPSLFKPGAEKLCLTFRLKQTYRYERITDDGHVTYIATCTLTHINSNSDWSEGVGSCTTREDRYAYRWQKRDKPDKPTQEKMKAKGVGRNRKMRGVWEWQERSDNPAKLELDNTILKMAAKRALVAAVLNATAVSDIFTQDVEDIRPPDAPEQPAPVEEPTTVTADLLAELRSSMESAADPIWSEESVVLEARRQFGGVTKLEDLTTPQAERILTGLKSWLAARDAGAGD